MARSFYYILIFSLIYIQLQVGCNASEISKNIYTGQDSKLPKLICDAVKGTFSEDQQISTVSMAIFNNNFESSLVDETLKCMPKRLSATITDFRSEQHKHEFSDRKASIVVMIADEIDKVKFLFYL